MLNLDSRAVTVVQPPLSQAVGYVIVVVLGLIIATGMTRTGKFSYRCVRLTVIQS
jgi:hypothetical protein